MPEPEPHPPLPTPRPGTDDHLATVVRTHRALGKMSASQHRRILADIRNQLPVAAYLNVLHTLAVTGMLPEYDPPAQPGDDPKPNGRYSPPDRVLQQKTLTYLVDKAMQPIDRPHAPTTRLDVDQDTPLLEQDGQLSIARARSMTVAQLVAALRTSISAERADQPARLEGPAPDA